MLTEIAAATETEPSELEADGAEVEPEFPGAPVPEAWLSALVRWPRIWLSTSPLGPPVSPWAGAPVAEAVEELEVAEVPVAWNVTPWVGPVPAVTLRSVKADTRWLA